jgi:hypothetical protein
MRILRRFVKRIVMDLEARREEDRGNQPLLVYNCFLGRSVEDTRFCESCRCYHYCKSYLAAVRVKEEDRVRQQFLKSVEK